jgi:hypothetical protein
LELSADKPQLKDIADHESEFRIRFTLDRDHWRNGFLNLESQLFITVRRLISRERTIVSLNALNTSLQSQLNEVLQSTKARMKTTSR